MNPGRLVLPALRWRRESGFAHEDRAIDAALERGVGGFIVFGVGGARSDEIGRLTEEVRHRAGRPLLMGADLERGAGQQARRLTEIPPPRALASLEDESVITWAAATTAREARRLGIDWVFAPDADLDLEPQNPIVQTRAFGSSPDVVSRAVTTWIRAAQQEGILACAKHYPGHGRTRRDSHETLPQVPLPVEALAQSDLRPFQAAIEAGVAGIMTAHVAYPAWDPGGLPATQSAVILGYLRSTLGFDGLVVTDALIMEGARGGRSEEEAVVRALVAGCDLLLYPSDLEGVVGALRRAAEESETTAKRVTEALARYEHALARIGGAARGGGSGALPPLSSEDIADRLLARGFIRGAAPSLTGGFELEIIDDDQEGWYAPGPSDLVVRQLARHRIFERVGGARVILAFAEPRAAKGRAGFGPASLRRFEALLPRAALVVLFGHPRLGAEIPGDCPILCAWHRQPLMQQAVARWLERRVASPVGAAVEPPDPSPAL
jgi:beta-glucosidase-like glycosyl hydrolase